MQWLWQGTFVYMAPEMMFLMPGQELTTKADIFSYAVTLWEVCTPGSLSSGQPGWLE